MEKKPESSDIAWREPVSKRRGEELLKNLAVAASLVVCAVTLKSGALPQMTNATDAVVSAMTDDTLLDDQLGKLSFVSSLFPEATLVFGMRDEGELALPVSQGSVVHVWSEHEPYLAWQTEGEYVYASTDGTVMAVAHGAGEERLVQVRASDGMICVYGNLREAYVQAGDWVEAGELLGNLIEGKPCIFEVRVDGVSVDPARYLANVL